MEELCRLSREGDMPRRLPKYCFEDKDRHGNIRIYFRRKKGEPKIRLQGQPWTPSFMEAYERVMSGEAAQKRQVRANTWEWLCRQYFDSGQFSKLSARTQRIRQRRLASTFDEVVRPGAAEVFGNCPLERFGPKAIEVLRDRLKGRPGAANERLKAIRQVLAFGARREDLARDPGPSVPYFSGSSDGFHTWTPEEVRAYEAKYGPGTKERRALALLLYVGPRRSDLVRLGRQMARDGWLAYRPVKTPGILVEVPILAPLAAELELAPKGALTFLETEFGKPYTANGFGNWFRRRCRDVGLPQCSAHGLRKAGAVILAERGATDAQLMAIYGWTAAKTVTTYRKKADRKKLAGDAMHLLVGTSSK